MEDKVKALLERYKLSDLGVAELGYDKFLVRAPKNNTSKRRAYAMS
jgi:hypothetical protein